MLSLHEIDKNIIKTKIEEAAIKTFAEMFFIDLVPANTKLEIVSELVGEGNTPINQYLDFKRDELGNIVKDRFGRRIKALVDIDTTIPPIELPKFADFDEVLAKLKTNKDEINAVNNAIGSSFQSLVGQISSSLETGSAIFDAFIGSFIQSGFQLLQGRS